MSLFLPIKKFFGLVLDVIVTISGIVGLAVIVAPYFKGYEWIIIGVGAIVFALPLIARMRQPRIFREYSINPISAKKQIITKEAIHLTITETRAKVEVSSTYVYLEIPKYNRDFIEAEDDRVKSFGAKALNYKSMDSKIEKFEPKGPNQYLIYWKSKKEITPFFPYLHKYEYLVPTNMKEGVLYVFGSSTSLKGLLKIAISSHLDFAQFECFATRKHFKDSKQLTKAFLFKPNDINTIAHSFDKERNEISIEVKPPDFGFNYYIVWSHDGQFREILIRDVEKELKEISNRRRRYVSHRYYALKRLLKQAKK